MSTSKENSRFYKGCFWGSLFGLLIWAGFYLILGLVF
jgi:hypothetical protein